jgi:lysophospholipase L1-like esterase
VRRWYLGAALRRPCGTLILALMALVAAPAGAQTPPPPGPLALQATAGETGWIAFTVSAQPGSTVRIREYAGEHSVRVATIKADATGTAAKPHALPWLCTRRTRRFVAFGTGPDGRGATAEAQVGTPACDHRLALRARGARTGRPLTVTVVDRWKAGAVTGRVCLGAKNCHAVRLRRGRAQGAVRLRPQRPGRRRLTLTVPGAPRTARRIRVRGAPRRLTVLATGDSMIQIIDGFLARRLERPGRRVISDAHISTGISKPGMLNWPAHATGTSHRLHPDATVVFLGANDGFPIGGAQCCGPAWVKGYARRAGAMMSTYARHGAGTVYWLTLPVPRRPAFKPIYRAVNRALRRAARRHPGAVRLVDLNPVFSPHGRFQASITWHGRTRVVRQADGVHLNVAGASIAATIIMRAMRHDGLIGAR